MSGFAFQLVSGLLDLAKLAAYQRTPAVYIETLSDITSRDGGVVIVTQAKLTLSSSALKEALLELWSIYELARRLTPSLVSSLRFRVRASRTSLADVQAAVDRWAPVDASHFGYAVGRGLRRTRRTTRGNMSGKDSGSLRTGQTMISRMSHAFG
jgi:hypothetical protein